MVHAYTPYQPEVSQGTLQSIYEYQSLLAELTGLDVVSASHYDGGAATAEAALMTCRATRRERVLVSRAVHPHYRETLATYFAGRARRSTRSRCRRRRGGRHHGPRGARAAAGRRRRPGRRRRRGPAQLPSACWSRWPSGGAAHAAGALFVAVVEPVSLAVLAPPGEYGADIAAGEGQPLGIPLQYGGPYLGLLACTEALVRQIPGRLVGLTTGPRRPAGVRDDASRARAGHPAREGGQQHLHQPGAARAGRDDLPRDDRAARAARRRGDWARAPRSWRRPSPPSARRGSTPAPYLNEFAVRVPDARARSTPAARPRRARRHPARRLVPDEPALPDALLVCATEVTTTDEIERFAARRADAVSR